jgi:hypothetical protein
MSIDQWSKEIATLNLLREKVDRLERSRFLQAYLQQGARFSLRATVDEPMQITQYGPDEDAVDAFVLTLRFFLQNNERISIQNTAKLIDTLPVDDDLKHRVAQSRDEINSFLDSPPQVKIVGEDLTNRKVLDTFLYGGLAHAKPEKKAKYDEWAADPIIFGMLSMVFQSALTSLLEFLFWLRGATEEVLVQLERQSVQ